MFPRGTVRYGRRISMSRPHPHPYPHEEGCSGRLTMKLRRLVLIVLLVGGFWYLTSHYSPSVDGGSLGHFSFFKSIGRSGSELQLTEAEAAPTYDSEEQNNIAVYKRVLPSVVNITSTTLVFNFFYGTVPQQGQGSGFVLDKSGHILTNFHVVEGANRGIEVQLSNKRRYTARVVGVDKTHDLALLQIDAPGLQPVTLADSSGLQVGQKVYAIGNPFGLSGTMTQGIISSIRSIRNGDGAPIEDAIQTDAAINPGNSGGPLLNSHGEVIGINTMIASNGADQSSGIGFAIPINTAKAVLADLTRYGQVRRPSLGIVSYAIGPDLAQQMGLAADYGVLIQRVIPGGAAERAGLRGGDQQAYVGNTPIMLGGDLIVAIDGQQVTDPQDISSIMDRHQAGDVISVTILRGRRQMTVKLILGDAHGTNA
jgi:S1-C subfamily serine protease